MAFKVISAVELAEKYASEDKEVKPARKPTRKRVARKPKPEPELPFWERVPDVVGRLPGRFYIMRDWCVIDVWESPQYIAYQKRQKRKQQ